MTGARLTACLFLSATVAWAAPARWAYPDAPYRAVFKLAKPADEPAAGVALELPEFGNTTDKLLDVVLTDSVGELQPLVNVWRGAGQRVLFLAKELKADEEYFVYFGGARFRQGQTWVPSVSLLLETRPLAAPKAIETWEQMEAAWRGATDSDGAAWVENIYEGINPFAANRPFLTRYTGYLRTDKLSQLKLYTMSSDASFVVVNGKFEFGWPGEHPSDANVKNVHAKVVPVAGPWTKIEYYHAKTGNGRAAMVLGWEHNKKLETIPASAWAHPDRKSTRLNSSHRT